MCEGDVQQRGHNVPNNQYCQISRAIVGTVMMQRLLADRAGVAHFQITAQHWPRPTTGAAPAPTAQHCFFDRTFFGLFCVIKRHDRYTKIYMPLVTANSLGIAMSRDVPRRSVARSLWLKRKKFENLRRNCRGASFEGQDAEETDLKFGFLHRPEK